METSFEDIRPFYDDEIPAAMERIASDPLLIPAVQYALPNMSIEEVRQRVRSFKSVEQIQEELMYPVIKHIARLSVNNLTCSGFDKIDTSIGHIFMSNHRDITLDAFLLQFLLKKNGLPTTDITMGDNLLKEQIISDVCRANKMIRVFRKDDLSPRDFLENSKYLSEFIRLRLRITRSIWISQRNGRTKDGLDMTEPGIIKMLSLGSDQDFTTNINELGIIPVAISYEYEPCDILKAMELWRKTLDVPYKKAPKEDIISILTGIQTWKGDTHFAVCDPITREEVDAAAALPRAEQHKAIAEIIDRRICSAYKLHNTNFIAYDLLNKTDTYATMYTAKQKDIFLKHCDEARITFLQNGINVEGAYKIFLGIYANPIVSKAKYQK